MNEQVAVDSLDAETRRALERIRELLAETLPLLAVVESLLGIPEEERYVGSEFIPEVREP